MRIRTHLRFQLWEGPGLSESTQLMEAEMFSESAVPIPSVGDYVRLTPKGSGSGIEDFEVVTVLYQYMRNEPEGSWEVYVNIAVKDSEIDGGDLARPH